MDEIRNTVVLGEHDVLHADQTNFPGNYTDFDDSWNFSKFKKEFKIVIDNYTGMELIFDLIGIDTAFSNAIRRLLLSEVSSMAVDRVEVLNNTSIIPDDVLAHRLGLIPLKADSRMFQTRQSANTEPTAEDTLVYSLQVKCTRNPNAHRDGTDPDEIYKDHKVYTRHVKWVPLLGQEVLYTPDMVSPVHEDILLAKMRPGMELDMTLHAVKGTGRDHAKFSPVGTAYYRLMPHITLLKEVEGEMAERLQGCFSPGVIELVQKSGGKKVAKVGNSRNDMSSRNVFRYDDLKDAVKISKIRNHFIFSVESIGALPADVLVCEALKILQNKCRTFLDLLKHIEKNC